MKYYFLVDVARNGGTVLSPVPKTGKDSIYEKLQMRHVLCKQQWLGGTLTNFKTIRKIEKLHQQRNGRGAFERLPKKEVVKLKQERQTREEPRWYQGLDKLPSAIL